MEMHNRARDASINVLRIEEIINAIGNWKPLTINELPEQLRKELERVLPLNISVRSERNKTRKFPQLEVHENAYRIHYFHENNISSKEEKNVVLQLSIATVLIFCPRTFIDDELRLDETICSFCERYPEYANHATKVHNAIMEKIRVHK